MKQNYLRVIEKLMKSNLKNKFNLCTKTIIAFLLLGGISFSEIINEQTTGGEKVAKDFTEAGQQIIDENLKITVKPTAGTSHAYPKGMIVRGNSNVTINGNLDVEVTLASENNPGIAPDSNASYGLAVGYAFAGGNSTDSTFLKVKDAKINVTNTPNTRLGTMSFNGATAPMGHQLSGLKIFRAGGAIPTFESTGKLDINVVDSSTEKIGDYLVGVYISGDGSKAILNDSNIKVSGNGRHSAALKIGKPELPNQVYADSYQGASVHSKGNMILDTRETKDSATIRLFGTKSQLIADYDTSSGEIHSADSAIVYDIQDYSTKVTYIIKRKVFRNENGNKQVVRLKDTIIGTTSETASLIKARAASVADLAVFIAGAKVADKFNNGSFAAKDAEFVLTGKNSLAIAAPKGWLIETEAEDSKTDSLIIYKTTQPGATSSLKATLTDGARAKGLVEQKSFGIYHSKLDMNIENGAVWELAPKTDLIEQRSTLSSLNLINGGILDAGKNLTTADKAIYFIKMTSNGTDNDKELINDGGLISLVNSSYNDILTVEGNYKGLNGAKLRVNTLWNNPGDINGGNSESDLFLIKGSASGETDVETVDKNGRINYIDGSIGSIESDLNANSAVVARVEGIDENQGNTFKGTAKTNGAGELQLASRKKVDANTGKEITEYFWTITLLNPKPEEPKPEKAKPEEPKSETPKKEDTDTKRKSIQILNSAVPAYVLMPRVNMDLAYSTLRTLHERRGENQIINWDNYLEGKSNKDQLWARVFKENRKVIGKNRFEYKTRIDGVQVGNDFKIAYGEDTYQLTGLYFAYAKADIDFYDKYRSVAGRINSDKKTGDGKSEIFSLGLTSTKYHRNGFYLDTVGQISWFHNRYIPIDNPKAYQKTWGLTLSAETGKPYELKNSESGEWSIEPQAQLVYQFLDMRIFNDGIRYIDQGNQYALRGRIGLRLNYNNHATGEKIGIKQFYGIANLWQDFLSPREIAIGKDNIREKYNKTTGEIGLGIQLPISEKSYIYADIRYENSLKGVKNRAYRGTLGIKYTW